MCLQVERARDRETRAVALELALAPLLSVRAPLMVYGEYAARAVLSMRKIYQNGVLR